MQPRPPRTRPIEHGHDRPYTTHIFVCTDGPECPRDGPAAEIRATLKQQVRELGAQDRIRINKSGCLGQCGHGPMMVAYPEGAWYSHLDVATARQVLARHLQPGAAPLESARYRIGPGGCKAPRAPDGASTCSGECRGAHEGVAP